MANWSSRELVVALDGAGNEGGEVERVKEVRTDVNVLLLPVTSRFDQQVKDTEEDIGKAQGKIKRMEEDCFGQKRVFLEPYIDEDNGGQNPGEAPGTSLAQAEEDKHNPTKESLAREVRKAVRLCARRPRKTMLATKSTIDRQSA